MFKAYVDGVCFYDDRLEENTITGLSLKLEENKGGSFEFTLYPDNPWYASFEKLVSTVIVKQDGKIIFRGRVLDSEESFFRERKITCEGEYAFLNDGIFYPLGSEPVEATSDDEEDQAGTRYTPIEIFTQIITDYNSQVPEDRRFNVGSISIEAAEEEIDYWNLEFKPSIDAMDDLIEQCGGHVMFRHDEESGVVYIDWTDDYQLLDQSVEFGRNLLDLTQTIQADELVTAILAHGETDENRNIPTNISHMNIPATETHMQMGVVPEGPDDSRDEQFGPYGILLVNVPLYQQYGLIIEERSYDGYPADWVDQLIEDVDGLTGLSNSIEVEAVDLAWLGSGEPFEIGRAVKVTSDRHGISDEYHITKIDVDLQDPSSSKITFGKTLKNFVEQIVDADRKPIDGQSIKVTGYQFDYAVSDSGLTPPDDSEFADTYTPESGKWLWTRVTTKFNDGSSTKCYYPSYQGKDAKTFRIKTDNTVVVRNDRKSDAQSITFTAEISGYPDAIPIWYIGSVKVAEGGSYVRSIPYKDAEGFTISLFNGTSLMDTLALTVIDKTGGTLYLGTCDTMTPTVTGTGDALIQGDYFLCSKNFDSYVAGNPYYYINNQWTLVDVNENMSLDEYSKIMSNCLNDALDINTNIDVNTRFMSWFKNLASKQAFIQYLGAQCIHIIEHGVIYGGGYNEDGENKTGTPGFHLSADNGLLRAWGAILNGSFECSDLNGIVLKTYFGQKGGSYPCSAKSRWNSKSLCDSLSRGARGSCTYDGTSYSYVRTNSSNIYSFSDKAGWDNGSTYAPKFPCKIRLSIFCSGGGLAGDHIKVTCGSTVYEENRSGRTHTYEFDMTGFNNVYVQTLRGNDYTVSYIIDAVIVYSNIRTPQYAFGNWRQANSKSFVISGIFDSSNSITLAPITGWLNSIPSGSSGCNYSAESAVTIEGASYVAANAIVTDQNFIMTTLSGEQFVFQKAIDNSEFSESGWGDIAGTLICQLETRGISVSSFYPVNESSAIGTSALWFLSGFIKTLNSLNINCNRIVVDDLPESTDGSGLPAGTFYRNGKSVMVSTG